MDIATHATAAELSDDFPHPVPQAPEPHEDFVTLREAEKRYIERVLRQVRGRQQTAAKILGISRWSLARRLRRFGLQPRLARAAAQRTA
jgi:DNA-binding NtrC family response regulator